MVDKLTELTPEQTAAMHIWADEWIAKGLNTKPADRHTVEEGIRACYRYAGLVEPKTIVWVDNPLTLSIAAPTAAYLIDSGLTRSASVAVEGAVHGAVDDAVGDAVDSAVGGVVRGAVGDVVDDAVRDAVGGAVGGAVVGAVVGAVDSAVDEAVSSAVHGAVDVAVRDAVGDAVGSAVRDAVGSAVGGVVLGAVGGVVRGAVHGAVHGAVGDAVHGAVHGAVNHAVDGAVSGAVDSAIDDAVDEAVSSAVHGAVNGAVHGAVDVAVGDAVVDAVVDAVDEVVHRAVNGAVGGAVGGAVVGAVHRAVDVAVGGAVVGAVDSAVEGAVGDAVDGAVKNVRNRWYYRLGGSLWANWNAHTSFFRVHTDLQLPGDLWDRDRAYADAQSAGWWWPHREFVMVCDNPDLIVREQVGPRGWGSHQLHNDCGPAIRWSDGWSLHFWHGTKVPAWVIEAPTIELIQAETNSEIRRCAIESYGWDLYLYHLGAGPIDEAEDPGNPGHRLRLFDIPDSQELYSGNEVRLLVMENASKDRDGSRRTYAETVPASIKTCIAAAAWQFDVPESTYSELVRAT